MEEIEKPTKKSKITGKHLRFVDFLFLNNMNASRAHLLAYKTPLEDGSYSKVDIESSTRQGSLLLRNVEVQAEIDRRLAENSMRADEAIYRLSCMARASILPFVKISEDGAPHLDLSGQEAKELFFLIKKIKTKRSRRVDGRGENAEVWEDEDAEIELYDAQAALEKLGRYHKLFDSKTQLVAAIDLDKMSREQIERIANGEDPIHVLATPGQSQTETS